MPHDYPKWSTVKSFYYRAIESGLWEKIMDFLVKEIRKKAGRTPEPSYCLMDSQSAKPFHRPMDVALMGEKKIKGRKRHISTEIMGNLLVIKVHAANIHDTMGGYHVYQAAKNKMTINQA